MEALRLIRIFALVALGFFLMPSCEDVVDVELNDEDVDLLAVEAYINTRPANNIFVKLEKSLPVSTPTNNPPVNNAIVRIADDGSVPSQVILEEQGSSGIYRLPEGKMYEAVPGKTYTLSITTTDGTVITGEEYLQPVEKLDSVKVNLSARGNFEFLAVFINSQETPGPGNYYKWDIYKNGQLINESENMSFVSDELVDGNYVYDFEIFTDFYNSNSDDEEARLQMGDTIYVEQLSISKSAYEFYIGMVNQAFTGSPFSVPPANLPGNLTSTNGKRVLGLFSARDISRGNSLVIDSTNYTPLSTESK